MTRIAILLVSTLLASFPLDVKPIPSDHSGTIRPAAAMLEARSGHTATLLPNGKVLITGGMRRNQDFYRSAELYDPLAGKFERTGDMNEPRVGHFAVLLRSGEVLIAGGWVGGGCTTSAELYDPATGRFTALSAKMTIPRGDSRAVLLSNGDVLITGGADHNSRGGVAAAELFDSSELSFVPVEAMHVARVSHTATLLQDGRVLIVGGRGDQVSATAEIYDPVTRHFAISGSMATARYKHTAGLLPNGKVLVAGGSDERDWDGNLNSVELYDPKTGHFQAAPSMHETRFKLPEEAVELSSGNLLVAGGNKDVEVFDPSRGQFLVADGRMKDSRHFMSETRLNDGSVLLAGGYANNDQATAETWIYRP